MKRIIIMNRAYAEIKSRNLKRSKADITLLAPDEEEVSPETPTISSFKVQLSEELQGKLKTLTQSNNKYNFNFAVSIYQFIQYIEDKTNNYIEKNRKEDQPLNEYPNHSQICNYIDQLIIAVENKNERQIKHAEIDIQYYLKSHKQMFDEPAWKKALKILGIMIVAAFTAVAFSYVAGVISSAALGYGLTFGIVKLLSYLEILNNFTTIVSASAIAGGAAGTYAGRHMNFFRAPSEQLFSAAEECGKQNTDIKSSL